MAGRRSKTAAPVGSAQWISNERGSALQFVQQEVDEFGFSARNEMEWLNEHMVDIFDKAPISIAEVFKTPGKLRGKTPRTARKRNGLEGRAPLTDIFAPNLRALTDARDAKADDKAVEKFEAVRQPQLARADTSTDTHPGQPLQPRKGNLDSGYHGSTEDEKEINKAQLSSRPESTSQSSRDLHGDVGTQDTVPITYPEVYMDVDDGPAPGAQSSSDEEHVESESASEKPEPAIVVSPHSPGEAAGHAVLGTPAKATASQPTSDAAEHYSPAVDTPVFDIREIDGFSTFEPIARPNRSPSQKSSPLQPVVRKSSLSFATLPAREALTAKSSIDHRISRTSHLDHPASLPQGRAGPFSDHVSLNKPHVGQSGPIADIPPGSRMELDDDDKPGALEKDSEDLTLTRLHRKTSTQRLHERISQLGQSQSSRPTKSIPSIVQQLSQPERPDPPVSVSTDAGAVEKVLKGSIHHRHVAHDDDDDDDDDGDDARRPLHISAAVPDGDRPLPDIPQTSTKQVASSALDRTDDMDVDAAPLAPAPQLQHTDVHHVSTDGGQREDAPSAPSARQAIATESHHARAAPATAAAQTAPPAKKTDVGATRPSANVHAAPNRVADGPISASKAKLSSILKSARGIFASSAGVSAQAKMETLSPATNMRLRSQANKPATETVGEEIEQQAGVPLPEDARQKAPEAESSQGQAQGPSKGKEPKRPLRPGKAAPSKSKPGPVAIKVGTASQRELDNRKVNPPNSALASSLSHSLAPSTAPSARQPAASGKTNGPSLRKVTSNSSLKSSAANPGKPRALAAAARKKEQEEREAQRKLEAKRELERRKAASQEEERRKEQQRKELETQRQQEQAAQAEDSKKAAQRAAIERRRLENARKQEQQRSLQTQTRARAGNDATTGSHQEKAQVPMSMARGELNNARSIPKMAAATNVRGISEEPSRTINHPLTNPARPPKRAAPAEEHDDRSQGAAAKTGLCYVQIEAKRRHTDDEDEAAAARQAMPPPMRQSTLRKDVPNKSFLSQQAYMNASSSQNGSQFHGGMSTMKLTTPQQQQQVKTSHPLDINRFATAKIPFGDSNVATSSISNPAIAAAAATATSAVASASAAAAAAAAAANGGRAPASGTARLGQRNSPQDAGLREGDAISLPDIPTDSEDEYEQDGKGKSPFAVPDWAESPALRSLLTAQQLVDPETVFGPIAPLHMEEIFKNNKDRHHRFRNRTSSANWSGQDRLTQDEIRRDLDARRRLIANGEWSMGMGLS